MKYYVYMSQTKVDMLFPQIPAATLKGISAEFSASIGVLTSKIKTSEPPETTNVFAQATILGEYLHREGLVGSVKAPKFFIAGTHIMKWGYLWDYASGIAYFGYRDKAEELSLIGARDSLVGEAKSTETTRGSISYYTYKYLNAVLGKDDQITNPTLQAAYEEDSVDYEERLARTAHAMQSLPKQKGKLEFLAKTLAIKTIDGQRVVVASPIYVALIPE